MAPFSLVAVTLTHRDESKHSSECCCQEQKALLDQEKRPKNELEQHSMFYNLKKVEPCKEWGSFKARLPMVKDKEPEQRT